MLHTNLISKEILNPISKITNCNYIAFKMLIYATKSSMIYNNNF